MSIRCGNRRVHTERAYHETIADVRDCHRGIAWPCYWLVAVTEDTEDGPVTREVECGALARELPGGRGERCTAGHEHVRAEVRAAEGWEYAEDEAEAQRLERAGVQAVIA